MVFCCVVKCGSNNVRDKLSFFRLPAVLNYKNKKHLNELSRLRRERWLKAIKREDLTETKLKFAFVCSRHFITGKPAELIDDLNPDWVPSQNMGYTKYGETSSYTKMDQFERKRKKLCVEESQIVRQVPGAVIQGPETSSSWMEESVEETLNLNNVSKCTQTSLTVQDITNQLLNIAIANEKIVKLQKVTLTVKNLENDNMQTIVIYLTNAESDTLPHATAVD